MESEKTNKQKQKEKSQSKTNIDTESHVFTFLGPHNSTTLEVITYTQRTCRITKKKRDIQLKKRVKIKKLKS